jgi:oligosaccharide repeat unit polymerase
VTRFGRLLGLGALGVVSIALGAVIATTNLGGALSKPAIGGQVLLAVLGVGSLTALRLRGSARLDLGPGIWIAALALSFAFILGLASGDDRIAAHRGEIVLLFALSVTAFLLGGALAAAIRRGDAAPLLRNTGLDPFDSPMLRVVIFGAFILAAVNFGTGGIPLFASNIDAVRFAGSGGAFGRLWIWIIGGIEVAVVLALVRGLILKIDRRSVFIGGFGTVLLILLAGRSFLLIVALSGLVGLAFLGRLSPIKLVAIGGAGLVLLGAVGAARVNRSDPTGSRRAYLASHHINGIFGLVSQSAASGPFVLASSLDAIPALIPFQGGRFLLRDLRATMPFHPFGKPDRADTWVTRAILHRDPAQIGGSPPTLVGGLYIDFGVPGIALGSAVLGFLLALLYRWARRAGSIGALTLYSYAAAYTALAAYSYVSFKPTLVVVAIVAFAAHRVEAGRAPA